VSDSGQLEAIVGACGIVVAAIQGLGFFIIADIRARVSRIESLLMKEPRK
jgi:hypothetical protein